MYVYTHRCLGMFSLFTLWKATRHIHWCSPFSSVPVSAVNSMHHQKSVVCSVGSYSLYFNFHCTITSTCHNQPSLHKQSVLYSSHLLQPNNSAALLTWDLKTKYIYIYILAVAACLRRATTAMRTINHDGIVNGVVYGVVLLLHWQSLLVSTCYNPTIVQHS